MNLNPYNTTAYENKHDWTLGQNKPNSNPIKPNLVRRRRIAKMKTSNVITKDYERNDIFAVPENKANSNPIKACPERIEFTLSVIEGNGPISKQPPFYHFQKGNLGGISL